MSDLASARTTVEFAEMVGEYSDFNSLLILDLGRCNMQAYLYWRITGKNSDYKCVWGQTYAAAATLPIPESYRPLLTTKTEAGTNCLYGANSFVRGRESRGEDRSSRIYGLAGEAMLNFGMPGVPLMFFLYGLLIGWLNRLAGALRPGDLRGLLLGIVVIVAILSLVSDMGNVVFFLLKYISFPAFLLYLSSRRTLIAPASGVF